MADTNLLPKLKIISQQGVGIPLFVLSVMSMMVLPLPPFLLDLLFTFNIAFALVVLLAAVYSARPLDFAIFPTVLLLATLLRLSLNVASTRVVLLNGHTGTDAAGQVVQSFGSVVIGGSYAVGLVVFAILVVINFVVVTKGAGRVSEVSARFTLDALPGKQMAIDADLNAGIINQEQAKERREEVAQEADFYGAMDGASKFVRGDAVAGILILFINIVGGLVIGTLQHDMSFSDALQNYALLTIGDGLVAQLPSLLLSTAAAIIVTRVSKSQDMSEALIAQIFQDPKTLYITGGIIAVLGLIPGMPHIPFLLFAVVVASGGYYTAQKLSLQAAQAAKQVETPEPIDVPQDLSWQDVAPVDAVGLEVGYRIIPMVDNEQGGQLLSRIKGIRKKLSQELGFLLPAVHIRDNLDLGPNTYRITLAGVNMSESEVFPDKMMAINPGQVFGDINGLATTDPAFGLPAYWIDPDQQEQAQSLGYTVVDAGTVIATHMSQILEGNAGQLLGHEQAQKLLDRLGEQTPKLISELVPDQLPLGTIVRVLQNLLSEHIPIRDIRTIVETLAESAVKYKDANSLTEQVRIALRRLIIQSIHGAEQEVPIITLAPDLENILQNSMGDSQDHIALEPSLAEKIQQSLQALVRKQEVQGQASILVVQPVLRKKMSEFFRSIINNLHVLSYHEIPENKQIKIVGAVG